MQSLIIGSNSMAVNEMVDRAIRVKGIMKKDLAEQMGWTPQRLSNSLRRNKLLAEDWVKLAKLIGYEIQMVDDTTGKTLKLRKESSSPRVVQKIDGYTYDTNKADSLCSSPKIYGGWFELFKDTASGKFFTVAYFETGDSACLALITEENARKFYLDCGGKNVEDYFKN